MSLAEKIPPLVSALAFGYGVGMAAPDVAVDSMHGALVLRAPAAVVQPMTPGRTAGAAPTLPPSLEQRLPGGESPALRELRAARGGSRYDEAAFSRDVEAGWSRDGRSYSSVYAEDLAGEADDFEASESSAISRLQLPDFGLGVSRQTLKYVRFFTKTDRGRGMFESWLKRSGRYQEMVQEELRARNLPEDLIWVAMIESGFDATARSPAGAVGLWQFMPATGAVYGLRQNKFMDQRKNPKLATQAAAHHLRDLYLRFGQWDLALAAYNMGYEQLLDRIDRVGTTDFNELARAGVLPEETSKYVPKIVAAAIVANNLERFGFEDVKVTRPVDSAELAVPPRTPLDTIAKAAGVPTSVIRKLNPDLLSKEVPPGKGDFLVQVPAESVSRAVASLPTMLDLDRTRVDDDVLDPMDLMSPDGFRPRQGDDQSLLSYLPKPKKKRHSLRSPIEDRLDEIAELEARPDDEVEASPRGRETVVYRVGSGDTLATVARQFSADADAVARENGLEPGAKLKEGSLLRLKVRREILEGDKPRTGRAGEAHSAKQPSKG